MPISDEEKYILDQAAKEVEHCRSWPTKVMAFLVAINFGIVGALVALRSGSAPILLSLPLCYSALIIALLVGLAVWVILIVLKNHRNYVTYRNLQVAVQSKLLGAKLKRAYELPKVWFEPLDVSPTTRWAGWSLYAFMVFTVTALAIVGTLLAS